MTSVAIPTTLTTSSIHHLLQARASYSARFAPAPDLFSDTSSLPPLPSLPTSPAPSPSPARSQALYPALFPTTPSPSPLPALTVATVDMASSGTKRPNVVASSSAMPDIDFGYGSSYATCSHNSATYIRQYSHSTSTSTSPSSTLPSTPYTLAPLPTDTAPPSLGRKRPIPLPPVPDEPRQHYSTPSSPPFGSPTSLYSRKTSIYHPSPRRLRVVTESELGHDGHGLRSAAATPSASPLRGRRPLTPTSPGFNRVSCSSPVSARYHDRVDVDEDEDLHADADEKRLSYRGPRVRRCTHAPWEEDDSASLFHNENDSLTAQISEIGPELKPSGTLGLSGLTKHANRFVRAASRSPLAQRNPTPVGGIARLTPSPSFQSTRTTSSTATGISAASSTLTVSTATTEAYPMAPSMVRSTPARGMPTANSAAMSYMSSVSSSSEATPVTPRLEPSPLPPLSTAPTRAPPSPSPDADERPTLYTRRKAPPSVTPDHTENALQLTGMPTDSPRPTAMSTIFPSAPTSASTGASPAFTLISLEAAQERERSRATIRATASARPKTLAHSPSSQLHAASTSGPNNRRPTTASRPSTAHEGTSSSPQAATPHRLKSKKSAFKLFSGKDRSVSSSISSSATGAEPMPPMPLPFERVDVEAVRSASIKSKSDAQGFTPASQRLTVAQVALSSEAAMDVDDTRPPELELRPVSMSFANALPQDYLSLLSPVASVKSEQDASSGSTATASSSLATITSLAVSAKISASGAAISARPTANVTLAPPAELSATDRVIAELRAQNRELQEQLAALRGETLDKSAGSGDGRCAVCGCSCAGTESERHGQSGAGVGGSVMDRARVKTGGRGKVFGSGSLYEWQ